ncbi:MAG: FecR family protein [Planctomycetes bacterium]|nr:FecR family protein [Planctomycetota bacterium]
MHDRDLDQFERLLARLDQRKPGEPEEAALTEPGDAEDLASMQELAHALADRSRGDAAHFTLAQVTELVRQRRDQGQEWVVPDHVAACPLCLEAFEIVLTGWSETDPASLARYRALFPGKTEDVAGRIDPTTAPLIAPRSRRRVPWAGLGRVAAAIAFIALLIIGWNAYNKPTGSTNAMLAEGGLVIDDGVITVDEALTPPTAAAPGNKPSAVKPIPVGQVLASGQRAIATKRTKLAFRDGSTLEIEGRSRIAVEEPVSGQVTVRLQAGAVTASVTKRKPGQTFGVFTPLGDVAVVGTRFSVACEGEDVEVFQNNPGLTAPHQSSATLRAVTVTVFEGIVRVNNRRDTVQVRAGHTATLHEDPPTIDIAETRP